MLRQLLRVIQAGVMLLAGTLPALAETVAEPPALPKDVDPLPADLTLRMKDLIRNAEKYRGLNCKHAVPCGSLGKEGLKKKMLLAFEEELPATKMTPLEASLKAFGFIPETMNLSKYYPDLLTSQVGGYYDPRRKYLVIVQNEGGLLGKEAKKLYGEELANRMEQTVMVHELTHAIQDQHFNLQKFAIDDPLSDEGAARVALIEGDATLTMYNFLLSTRMEDMLDEKIMKDMFKDHKQLMDMAPDMPGSKEMADAPAWFRDNLLFSYMQGFVFCINVKKHGGQKLLDHAFTKDPPRSTEQILHPEKWHTKRDDPVAITWPDLSKQLPGYSKLGEGQLGEQSVKVLLREALKDEAKATTVAAGWGGDRFAVYAKDDKRVLLWITEWDSNEDGKQFKEAIAGLGAEWNATVSRPSRVQLIRGKVEAADLAALNVALSEAKAEVPENRNMDLAALGIKPKAEGEDLVKNLEGLLDGKDIGALLNDPSFQKMAEQLAGGLGGKDGAGALDIGKMMKDPAVQEMLKKMFSQEVPKGKASDDGRTYTNEALGFTLKMPASQKDWKMDPKPAPPMSVLITDPAGGVQLSVVSQALPIAMPIETMGPMIEMGPKMAMQDYKRISAGMIETTGKKGYELQYEASADGKRLRSTQRVYLAGSTMIVYSAMAPAEEWTKNEKCIKEAIDSFSFIAPKEKPAGDPPKKAEKEPLKE